MIRKSLQKCLLSVLCMLLLAAFAGAQTVKYGDVDGNATINIVDALVVAQFYVGIITTLPVQAAGDVDANGQINIVDALMIAQYSVGLIQNFPAESGPTPTISRTPGITGPWPTVTLTPPGPSPTPVNSVGTNTTIVVSFGETVAYVLMSNYKLLVTFKDISDTRCPQGASCLVAGEAVATLDCWGKPYLGEFTIKAPPATPTKIYISDATTGVFYTVECTAIEPIPVQGVTVQKSAYKITLKFTAAIA